MQGILKGVKKIIHPIIYYLVVNFDNLSKRAYLAKYIMPLVIPNEFMMDDEMKNYFQQYRDLQAEFQVIHQQFDQAKSQALVNYKLIKNPNELKKGIDQYENEKEQLIQKINILKGKNQGKPEFQALLEATNALRREQEEEAILADKMRQLRSQIEICENQLLESQQRLIDSKKTLSPDNTPVQMLTAMRNEVKKNRNFCNDRLMLDINEKRAKLEGLHILMSQPQVSQDEIIRLENNVMILRRMIAQTEDKIANEKNPEDTNLQFYKQQAQFVSKKKEKAQEDLRRVEEEVSILQKQVDEKERVLIKEKGPAYATSDFNDYASGLREKSSKYKKMKEELKEIENEIRVLTRTKSIVDSRKSQYEETMKHMESKMGVVGYSEAKEKLEQIAEIQDDLDDKKSKTLEEISTIVTNIESQLKTKKNYLQPKLGELKDLRKRYEETDQIYKFKKGEYDQVSSGIQSEISALDNDLNKQKEEVYKEDSHLEIINYKSQILDQKIARLNDEMDFQAGKKKLSSTYPTYKDWFIGRIAKQDVEVKEAKKNRDLVKANYEPSLRQVAMFSDLKKILELKIMVILE